MIREMFDLRHRQRYQSTGETCKKSGWLESADREFQFYVGDPKEPRAAVQRLAATYGSVNYGCESSTACRRAALLAELLTYGFPTMGDLPTKDTKATLIWGTNPAYSGQPSMCHGHLADAKERGQSSPLRKNPRPSGFIIPGRPANAPSVRIESLKAESRRAWPDVLRGQ